jgi:hypothetical protein
VVWEFVHRPKFQITRKHYFSKSWSVPIFRWREGDTHSGSNDSGCSFYGNKHSRCLFPLTWRRKQITFPKHFVLYLFRIPNERQSLQIHLFWAKFSLSRIETIIWIPLIELNKLSVSINIFSEEVLEHFNFVNFSVLKSCINVSHRKVTFMKKQLCTIQFIGWHVGPWTNGHLLES